MFGPGVDDAIETYMKPDDKLLGVLQLFSATQKLLTASILRRMK
jgi:hypothetical protein